MSFHGVEVGSDAVRAGSSAVLTPISLVRRTAEVHPTRVAIRYGNLVRTYAELWRRSCQLASALSREGLGRGDVVAILAPNIPAHVEAHFGVPMMGGVLNSINIRLDANTIAYILTHSGARVLLLDKEYAQIARRALAHLERQPIVIHISDDAIPCDHCEGIDYEDWLAAASPDFEPLLPVSELAPIALCYTSGTTGKPKGVVYSHRGAYLSTLGSIVAWEMTRAVVYLWTLPMFHCAGWCFPWAVSALAGEHVCLRRPTANSILAAFHESHVTHLCGAPVILASIAEAVQQGAAVPPRGIRFMIAGASPPAPVLESVEALGFHVTHTYGLTETFGPCVLCEWVEAWNDMPPAARARLKARQGVRYALQEDVDVLDPANMQPVPADGTTMGEIMMRGNMTLTEYLHEPDATRDAFAGGWFHSGDLAVKHPDGYMEIRDRAKDLIISGGENISSLEIEEVLYRHPAIEHAAVVARPDQRWGETPCAFVAVRSGMPWDEDNVVAFCTQHLAKFKVPRTFILGDLPRTATGKVRKAELRERARLLE